MSPKGLEWEHAVAIWRTLRSDAGATWDAVVEIDATQLAPQVTWGTSPEMVLSIEDRVPDPDKEADAVRRGAIERALAYMGLEPNKRMADIRIDKVVHRLVHQQPDRGSARGGCRGAQGRRPDCREREAGVGRARLGAGEGAGRARRPGPGLQGRRFRVARAGVLDVPGDERRPARPGRALRLHEQPQFRGTPGRGGPHPPGQPRHGCRGSHGRAISSMCGDCPDRGVFE